MSQAQWSREFREVEAEMWSIASRYTSSKPVISLEWNSRFTRRMGDATMYASGSNRIRFSSKLWPMATPEKRRNTMIHELAHVYAHRVNGDRGHGRWWKQWMRRFGVAPERCYSVTAENFHNPEAVQALRRKVKKWEIACPGCGNKLRFGTRLRNNWINKRQTRRCNGCKTHLTTRDALAAKQVVS